MEREKKRVKCRVPFLCLARASTKVKIEDQEAQIVPYPICHPLFVYWTEGGTR